MVVTWNGTPTNKDEYLSVTGMKLGLSKAAVWTPVETGHDSTTVTLGQNTRPSTFSRTMTA